LKVNITSCWFLLRKYINHICWIAVWTGHAGTSHCFYQPFIRYHADIILS